MELAPPDESLFARMRTLADPARERPPHSRVQILEMENDEEEEDEAGAAMDDHDKLKGKSCVVKTTTRQTVYLPIPGLVPIEELKPGDLIGTNKDSYLILEKLVRAAGRRCSLFSATSRCARPATEVG